MTKINHIKNDIVEVKTSDPEMISKIRRRERDEILLLEEIAGELRLIVDLEEDKPNNLLKYIH